MLYEVITVVVLDDEHRQVGNFLRLAEALRVQGRFAQRLVGLLRQGLRITSYNVCYTKLLRFGFFYRTGRNHAHRRDLVVGSVGGVAAAGKAVELHVPTQFGLEPPFQAGP